MPKVIGVAMLFPSCVNVMFDPVYNGTSTINIGMIAIYACKIAIQVNGCRSRNHLGGSTRAYAGSRGRSTQCRCFHDLSLNPAYRTRYRTTLVYPYSLRLSTVG